VKLFAFSDLESLITSVLVEKWISRVTKPSVLAVDDEPAILELLQETLGDEGYEVVGAGTAAEFRELFMGKPCDVCIIDLALPDGNGLKLIRELRAVSDCGIIILTGRGGETDHVVGLEVGADDYITKPFRPRELSARVNALTRRVLPNVPIPVLGAVMAPAVQIDHEFDGYRLSSSARQIWDAGGKEIVLTTAEFSLLLTLLERRGRVLSRDQLMTLVKGQDWESYDRAIDGLVSRIRRKLVPVGRDTHYIRTVHGIGYVFAG
jgi:two-component system, OmpR family, response regulator